MPTSLAASKKVIAPEGETLIQKECKCGNEFLATTQARYEKCLEKKTKRE